MAQTIDHCRDAAAVVEEMLDGTHPNASANTLAGAHIRKANRRARRNRDASPLRRSWLGSPVGKSSSRRACLA